MKRMSPELAIEYLKNLLGSRKYTYSIGDKGQVIVGIKNW